MINTKTDTKSESSICRSLDGKLVVGQGVDENYGEIKRTVLSILLLLVPAFYSLIPLLFRSEFAFGQDQYIHVNWANQVSLGIKEGILYPRWLALSNGGYGSPTMIFYSPLFYWFTGVVNMFIPSLIVSLKITTFISFFLSGIFMYIYLRNYCGHIASG